MRHRSVTLGLFVVVGLVAVAAYSRRPVADDPRVQGAAAPGHAARVGAENSAPAPEPVLSSDAREREVRALQALGIDEREVARHAQSDSEQLDAEIAALKDTAEMLQSDTLELQQRHEQLIADGKQADAQRLMHDEMLPLLAQRQDLVREAVVLVRAKAMAMSSETRAN